MRCRFDDRGFHQYRSNALKFSKSRETAVITVGEVVVDGQLAAFISDDGVGFDMKYAHKLFGPFQRLHSSKDFEGLGAGLVTAQRIVHRHGGRIWANRSKGRERRFFSPGDGRFPISPRNSHSLSKRCRSLCCG
jgi:light-regulated signal transduction histidine kinase (bacteriophytochrome)